MGLERFDTVMSFVVVMLLLSMLVTIFVQCVVAVSGLRGWNLSVGVQQLIRQVDPGLAAHARKVADAVLEHPGVAYTTTFGGRRRATAIRQQELIRIMKDLATAPPAEWTQPTRDALTTAINAANAAAPPTEAVVAELTKLFPAQAQAVEDAVNRGLVQMSAFEVKVDAWFDTVMDRTTDRFVLHTRWITAACAFALAIGLQVDALQTFKQLSTNVEVRTRIVQDADAALRQSDGILNGDNVTPLASRALKGMAGDKAVDSADKATLDSVPSTLATRRDGHDWIDANMPASRRTRTSAAFDARFDEETSNRLKSLGASFDQVKASLNGTGLQLFGNAVPADMLIAGIPITSGMLVAGLFLSLGAPFWFNALKELANLRPVIAGKVDQED
jgi:hypothetical protein